MPSNEQSINVTFTKEETELYHWVLSQNQIKPKAWLGREAFACLRLCRQLFGDNWYANAQMAAIAHQKVIELFGDEWLTEIEKFRETVEKV